jgi:photosystem II stability/assembly factor-like uncharacterized protein
MQLTGWSGMCASGRVGRVVRFFPPGLLLFLALVGCQTIRSHSPQTGPPLQPEAVSALAVDTNGNLIQAANGLFRSTDQGRTWAPLPLPSDVQPATLRQVATTTALPSSLFAAGPGAGVVRSDDRGQTWRAISSSLPSRDVAAFAVHSFRPDTLYAWIDGQGVFRTEDGGDQWQKMDDGPKAPVVSLAHSTLPGSMNTGWLYAATPQGPYLSMDCF